MTEPTIVCPKCNNEIRLTESLAAPLIAATRQQFERQLSEKDADIASREQGVRERERQVLEGRRDAEVLQQRRRFALRYDRQAQELVSEEAGLAYQARLIDRQIAALAIPAALALASSVQWGHECFA